MSIFYHFGFLLTSTCLLNYMFAPLDYSRLAVKTLDDLAVKMVDNFAVNTLDNLTVNYVDNQ